MISIRSRAVSWILTLTLVFTTMFGSTGMAFADGSDTNVAKIGDTGYATLQEAIDAAVNGDVIEVQSSITGDVTVVQKENVKITIDGNKNTFYGSVTIDGKSARYETAAITIKDVNFDGTSIDEDACINLGVKGNNYTRYTNNVTVDNCTFTSGESEKVAIKSYTGGDWNLVVKDCNVDNTMHSLLQVTNVEKGLVIDGCTVNSKNGINLNSSAGVIIKNSDINVSGYAVRIGVSGGTSGEVELTNNTLTTNDSEGDATIVIRGTAATQVDLKMSENIVSGATHISGTTADTKVSADANYWDGKQAPVVAAGSTAVKVNNHYSTSDMDDLQPSVNGLEGEGTAASPYIIDTVAKLKWFRDDVNSGNNYSGKYVRLAGNLNLNGEEWTPIGNTTTNFMGVFDGNNKKISNLVINGGENSNIGFFGVTSNGEIKNLTINNAKVSGYLEVGVVAGTPYTSKYTNIKVTGHVEVNGFSYVGGVGGKNAYANWTDITVYVDDTSYVKATSTTSSGKAYRTYVGGVIGFIGEGGHTFKNITSNIKVIGDVCDIGGITGIAHYNNKFVNVTCTGDVENTNTNEEDIAETGGIAGVWHNEDGTTVSFEDCTFEGTVTAAGKDITSTNGITGAAYKNNNITENSGELIVDGEFAGPFTAQIGEAKYKTFADAIKAVNESTDKDIVIDLISNATLDITAWDTLAIGGENTETITVNGNGKKLTFNKLNSDWNHVATKNDAKLILNDMTITDSGHNNGPWNRYDINFACDVELNNVTSEKALAFKAGATLNDVTVNEKGDNYAIWIQANGQEVTINGLTVNSEGRGIKIDEQYVDDAAKVELSVKDASFTTAKKAAIMVKSAEGADITLENVNIDNVAADQVNAVWVDADSPKTFGKVTVTGGTVAQEDSENFEATITKAGKVIGYYSTLKEAFDAAKDGDEVTVLKAGTYALGTSGKDITITGAVDDVVFDNIGAKNMGYADVTFNNVTFDYYPNVNYTGLQHSGNLVYNNCTINGQVFLYGESETFNECTFNQNSSDAYNVWTYGAKAVEFNKCIFNSAGKSVLIYSEQKDLFNDVAVAGCEFNASDSVDGKAAIEMDSSLTSGINLTIDEATTAKGFDEGSISGNTLWNNKKDNKDEANNDITVKVGNDIVLAPTEAEIILTTIDSTVAGPEGMNVKSGVKDYLVEYKDGVYFLVHDHDYNAWSYVEKIDFTNPEAIAEGMYHQKACECGVIDEATRAPHDFEVKIVKEPTKEDPNGEAKLFCKECGYEETKTFEEIAAITTYLVTEYYDEAYAYAYAYADENGYIDATIEGIDAVVAALDEALAVANESGMSDELKAELNAAYENIIPTAEQLKVLIDKADYLDEETYNEAVKLLAELETNLNDFCSIMEQAGLDAGEQLMIAYEYLKPIVIEQLKLAVEAGTAWLMDMLGELYDAFIAALPEIDKALYDWFYNNPEKVIGFFYEYGDEFGYLFDKYGDDLACVLGYVLATYGPEAVEWALENPEEALAKWVEWYDKHGVRALAMIDKYIRTLDEMGAFDGIKASLKDLAAEVEAFIIDYAEQLVAALEAKYNELSDAAQAALADLKAAIENADIDAILAALAELEAEVEALYDAATSGNYIVTGDSYYVALGDSEAGYAQIVADEMKLDDEQFVNAAVPGITAEELADLLASGNEDLVAEIEKADFITVGFSNNTITAYAKDQVADLMARGAEEVDWEAVVGPNGAVAVEDALVDLEAALEAEGLGEAAEMVVTAVEAYAYACISFATNYPEVIDTIKDINPEAQVVIVGMYNPFENAVLEVEGVEVPVGEFVGALVDLANVHYVSYAMLTGNAVYVDAPAVETKAPFEKAMGIEELVVALADLEALEPSEAGNTYIAEQILKALNVVDKDAYNAQKLIDEIKAFGDVTRDNLEDAKALAEAARQAWDALTDEEKALIGLENYKVLVDFELAIAKVELGIAEDIAAAEKALADAQAKVADVERALKITESTVTDLKAKVQNKSQIKVTWEAAEITPDQYRVALIRDGKKVGTYWVAGDKESVVLKDILRGTNFTVRVTPVAKVDDQKYFSIYKTSNKVKTQLQKANLTVKKAGLKKQIISKDQNSTGYQIYISQDKNFKKDVKKLTYKTNKKGLNVKVKAKNFKKGTNYVKVRSYTKVNGKTVYGAWSRTVKTVK